MRIVGGLTHPSLSWKVQNTLNSANQAIFDSNALTDKTVLPFLRHAVFQIALMQISHKRRRRSRHRFDSIPNVPFRPGRRVGLSVVENEDERRSEEILDMDNQSFPVPDRGQLASERSTELIFGAPSYHGVLPSLLAVDGHENGLFVPDARTGGSTDFNGDASIGGTESRLVPLTSDVVITLSSPVTNWRVLWALLMTCGKQRYTKGQYQSLRLFLNALVRHGCSGWQDTLLVESTGVAEAPTASYLPHYSTLYKRMKPILFRSLTVRSLGHLEAVDLRKAGAKTNRDTNGGDPKISLRTVLLSEYAREDIATPHVFDAIWRTSLLFQQQQGLFSTIPRASSSECIDILPLIAARDWFYGSPKSITIDAFESTLPPTTVAEAGDTITLTLTTRGRPEEAFERCFAREQSPSGQPQIQGQILDIWAVRHEVRRGAADLNMAIPNTLSIRDCQIRELFEFVSYTSPTDAVSTIVPELLDGDNEENGGENDEDGVLRKKAELKEIRRRRKAVMDQRKRQMAEAWRDWEKPLIKPGDIVALLCPCSELSSSSGSSRVLTSTDKLSRLLLVNRFWTEAEERSLHVVWIPGGSDVDIQPRGTQNLPNDLYPYCRQPISGSPYRFVYGKDLLLLATHSGYRGPQRYSPVSSFGTLSTGESYFVYRFLLFWDGFQVQDGTEASGEGIYLLCLNLPPNCNRSPNDVRVISLTPPGVKSEAVLRKISDNISAGMTDGFVDFDASGKRRRIFLDLVGFIGDTPAINSSLDIMGHNASACCHLCRYIRRSVGIVGSRYTGRTSDGFRSAFLRGFFQQQAVRDCNPGAETCRLIGLKFEPQRSSLALNYIRSRILEGQTRIPLTMEGSPVVPCALDPYKACFVAPDHLFTGHVRDCINLGIRMLPTAQSREMFEGLMLGMLRECSLTTQNRLVNVESKKLHGMTMSELYSVSLVAPHAVSRAFSALQVPDSSSVAHEKCRAAVEIVWSASRLITTFWFKPNPQRDSTQDVQTFDENFGTTYLLKMRNLVDDHIQKIESICSMNNEDALALEDGTCSSARKALLSREQALCNVAKKTVDKPNVHRLRELVSSTLPMLGHVCSFGELPLEKSHQELKRAIRSSNKKDSHLQAMESSIFGDWQGRLSISASLNPTANNRALFSCFRLLFGRQELMNADVRDDDMKRKMVLPYINSFILKELSTQGNSVISKRLMASSSTPVWKMRNRTQVLIEDFSNAKRSSVSDTEAIALIKRFFSAQLLNCILWQSAVVTKSVSTELPSSTLSKGDIFETLTIATNDSSSHYPFVLQINGAERSSRNYIPTLWCVESFFSIENPTTGARFFAVVRPCLPIVPSPVAHETLFRVSQISNLSIAALDATTRRVPALHNCCLPCCGLDSRGQMILHCTNFTLLQGCSFIPFTRKGGFPPRMG